MSGGGHGPRQVTLRVPEGLRYQLVYRLELTAPLPAGPLPEGEFRLLDGPGGLWSCRGALLRRWGAPAFAKALAKAASGRRLVYLVLVEGAATATGWCSLGFCRHYKVEPEAVVVGPIWTDPDLRGRGLATGALMAAMEELRRRGRTLFYIDTSGENLPSQRVIEKCGFGPPLALYVRD